MQSNQLKVSFLKLFTLLIYMINSFTAIDVYHFSFNPNEIDMKDLNMQDDADHNLRDCRGTQTRGRCSSSQTSLKLKAFFTISVSMVWLRYPGIRIYWVKSKQILHD